MEYYKEYILQHPDWQLVDIYEDEDFAVVEAAKDLNDFLCN